MSKGGSFMKNSGRRPTGDLSRRDRDSPSNGQSKHFTDSHSKSAVSDKLLYLLAKSIGTHATVTVSSGARYRGIFSAAQTGRDLGLVLNQAEKCADAPGEEKTTEEFYEQLIILPEDFKDVYFEETDLTPDQRQGFRTDTDISAKQGQIQERELEKWTPDDDAEAFGDLETSTGAGTWDQFAVNEQKFGLQSTYDEHYYTVAIDKSHPDFLRRQKEADRLATEINSSAHGGNIHLAEERNQVVDDSGLDEEDKYSGVDRRRLADIVTKRTTDTARTTESGAKAYTPPHFRPTTGDTSSSAVPYDPAIISSSLAEHDGNLLPKSESKSPEQHAGNGIEHEIVGNFRQFVSVEVERLNQKKQQLQRKQKSERLDDFKKFSADYKINAPVPPDLIPLMAKEKEKQEAILQKSATIVSSKPSSATGSPSKVTESPTPAVPAPAVPTAPAEPAKTQKPEDTKSKFKPKFNFNAAGFKPSAAAASFTPNMRNAPPVATSPVSSQRAFSASPSNVPDTFFGDRKPKPKRWEGKFNPLHERKVKTLEDGKFSIERAYVTPPTWFSTIDSTYSQVFASKHEGQIPGSFQNSPAHLAAMMQPAIAFDERGNPIIAPPGQFMPGIVPAYGMYNQQYMGRNVQPFSQFVGYMSPTIAAAAVGSPRSQPPLMPGSPVGQYYAPYGNGERGHSRTRKQQQ